MFQFLCSFAFLINFSSFTPDAENNANFDAVSSKCTNFDEVHFFKLQSVLTFTFIQTFDQNFAFFTEWCYVDWV